MDNLFNDKISDDSENAQKQQDEQYEEMRGRLEDDDEARENFMNNLELPKYDGEENPILIKNDLLALNEEDQEDQAARKEAEKKRLEYMNKLQ